MGLEANMLGGKWRARYGPFTNQQDRPDSHRTHIATGTPGKLIYLFLPFLPLNLVRKGDLATPHPMHAAAKTKRVSGAPWRPLGLILAPIASVPQTCVYCGFVTIETCPAILSIQVWAQIEQKQRVLIKYTLRKNVVEVLGVKFR